MREHRVPNDIIADLAASSYGTWISIGPVDVVPVDRIPTENKNLVRCLENGLLVVAGCRNGDPVAVDRATRRIIYVSHDELWSSEPPEDFRQCIHSTPYSYDDFWLAANSTKGFPFDYYEARRVWPNIASTSEA